MHDHSIYSAIVGLSSTWRILDVTVDDDSGAIELHIRSRKGSRFACPVCGAVRVPSGVSRARWEHRNHLNIPLFVSALIPVISCEQCGESRIRTPWEQQEMRFEE